MKKIAFWACVVAVAASATLPLSVVADTLTWKGGATGQFSAPSNWTSANEGGTSTLGPQPGDTVKFTSTTVNLADETFDFGSAGLTIDNSKYVTNSVRFVGSGKVVKKGTATFDFRTLSTHTGGTRVEGGVFSINTRASVKSFGTGAIELVYSSGSGYNSRPQMTFLGWGEQLTNEVRIVNTSGDYAALRCSNAATISGPISADGDFTIYNSYGSFTITAPINAHGHAVTAFCVDSRNNTWLNIKSAIDASLVKTGSRPMHLSGVSN